MMGTITSLEIKTNLKRKTSYRKSAGQIGLSGANYGTSGQVLTSQGSGSAAPQWAMLVLVYGVH